MFGIGTELNETKCGVVRQLLAQGCSRSGRDQTLALTETTGEVLRGSVWSSCAGTRRRPRGRARFPVRVGRGRWSPARARSSWQPST